MTAICYIGNNIVERESMAYKNNKWRKSKKNSAKFLVLWWK